MLTRAERSEAKRLEPKLAEAARCCRRRYYNLFGEDELINECYPCLLRAVQRFRPERNRSIEAYVFASVLGCMNDASARELKLRGRQIPAADCEHVWAAGHALADELGDPADPRRDGEEEMRGHLRRYAMALQAGMAVVFVSQGSTDAAAGDPGTRWRKARRRLREGWLRPAITRLPDEDRALMECLVEGMTIPQTAAQLGITTGQAEWRKERSLRRLRALLPEAPDLA